MKKIDRCKQIEAVQRFCKDLPDGKEFTVCVLLMKGMKESKVRRRMRMKPDAWKELKEQIAEGLKNELATLPTGSGRGCV